ncbi:MAG: site-specific DNA-methyltransferase [Pseudoflavonifractor sp.]|nr:site-specific DNA-methyltransferase [Pseudoflavonifractor sp.]
MKAERNRTLVIEDGERENLATEVARTDAINSRFDFVDTTICGDLHDVIDKMPERFADLIIADPPYNLSKDFNGLKFRAMKGDDYEDYLRSWLPAVCRRLKPTGTIYLCCDWRSTAAVQRVLGEELTIINRITWQREKGRGAARNWKNGMEDIWMAVKNPRDYYFDVDAVKVRRKVIAPYRVNGKAKDWDETSEGNFRTTCPSNFWDDISVPFWSMPENTDHPTQKAEKLYAKLILASSRPGDMVFDPFLGSGTASVVARKLGRHYCGVEQDMEYCLYAAKRLRRAATDPAIQGYHDGIFWERNSHPSRTLRSTADSAKVSGNSTSATLFQNNTIDDE